MVTFRNNNNNNRRPNFRRNDRNFKSGGDRSKFKSSFAGNDNFQRKVPGRNNHNASKLIEKYNDLAREALVSEDKILSENYFQHADHFTRVQNEQEKSRTVKVATETDTVENTTKLEKNTESSTDNKQSEDIKNTVSAASK